MGADDPAQFEQLLQFLQQNRGFDFTGYKRPSLERRVERRMQMVSVESFADYKPLVSTQVVARDGTLIGEFYKQRRTVVPLEKMPKHLVDAVVSADIIQSIASRSAASAPNPGLMARGASMKPAQNRTGSASALSQDNQDVTPGGRAAAQSESSTLLPAPADPTTVVSR